MYNPNNPLRQYFRRPAIYLKLPSNGKYYDNSIVENTETNELPVFPMTAIDDIATKTPDALYNGEAMAQLIRSCIPNIKDPWKINSIDFDAILVAIKIASQGSTIEIKSTCPECSTEGEYNLELAGLLSQFKPGDYSRTLQLNELEIKFKPLTYKEMNQAANGQFQAQKMLSNIDLSNGMLTEDGNKKTKDALEFLTNLTMEILAKTIEYIKTPNSIVDEQEYILDFLKNCDKNEYLKIRDYNGELKSTSNLKPLHIKCGSCGHEFDQSFTLNASDFFG